MLTKDNRLFFLTCGSCGSTRSVAAIKSGFQAVRLSCCPRIQRRMLTLHVMFAANRQAQGTKGLTAVLRIFFVAPANKSFLHSLPGFASSAATEDALACAVVQLDVRRRAVTALAWRKKTHRLRIACVARPPHNDLLSLLAVCMQNGISAVLPDLRRKTHSRRDFRLTGKRATNRRAQASARTARQRWSRAHADASATARCASRSDA